MLNLVYFMVVTMTCGANPIDVYSDLRIVIDAATVAARQQGDTVLTADMVNKALAAWAREMGLSESLVSVIIQQG